MKLLHTSDWHLGRQLHGVSLLEDQRYVIDRMVEILVERGVDVLLVSGDVDITPSEMRVSPYPRGSLEMMVTLAPALAAWMAAITPAPPEPMTSTSDLLSCMSSASFRGSADHRPPRDPFSLSFPGRTGHLIATGLSGEPTAPLMLRGCAARKNS